MSGKKFLTGKSFFLVVSLKIPLVGLDDEIRIVRKEIEKQQPAVYLPLIFLRLAVEVVRALRGDERLELGPRTGINAGLIACSSALLEGRRVVSFCNMREGIFTAVPGKALFEDKADIERKIDTVFPSIHSYIQNVLRCADLAAIAGAFRGVAGREAKWRGEHIKKLIQRGSLSAGNLDALAGWIYEHEAIQKYLIHELMAEYLEAFERGCDNNRER